MNGRTPPFASQDIPTDEQWATVGPLIPAPAPRADRRGRPWRGPREVLGGVLWVLGNDAHWRALPERFPPHQTCRRRFRQWLIDGTLRVVLEALEQDLRERGGLDVAECTRDDALGCEGGEEGRAGETPEPASWRRQTAALLLSPATRRLLRRTGSPLARRFWPAVGGSHF